MKTYKVRVMRVGQNTDDRSLVDVVLVSDRERVNLRMAASDPMLEQLSYGAHVQVDVTILAPVPLPAK